MHRKNLHYFGFGNFLYLLISLLLFLISYPILLEYKFGQVVLTIFFTVIFFSSIYAIGKNKLFFIIAILLSVIAIGLKWLAYLKGISVTIIVSDIFNILCFAFIAATILSRVLVDKKIALNDIYGAVCAYLLIGLTWAFIYSAIEYFHPGALYIPKANLDAFSKLPYLIYFSFITLTTTGYGDIYPIGLIAKSLAYIEAIVGQIYLVVLIGWMVGIYVSRSRKKEIND